MQQVPSPVPDKFCIECSGNEYCNGTQQDRVPELCWSFKYHSRGIGAELKDVLKRRLH